MMREAVREAIKKLTGEARDYIHSISNIESDEAIRAHIDGAVFTCEDYAQLSDDEKSFAVDTVICKTRKKLGILQPLADDGEVSEIMVNGPRDIFIEKNGRVIRVDAEFESGEELEEVIRRIGADIHREINELSPILDARLADGSRVNAVYRNVALNGPILTIRKFPESRITMNELLEYGTLTEEAAEFLVTLVEAAYNIFISGGTTSGKTTFLNALSNFIPKHERIVTIEDSAELQITEIENIVKLECRNANAHDKGEVNMTQLIRASLRMRPDRIIVGEVRGAEVLDMIQAMNTGHSGSLSTGHANSPAGMLYRLEAMFLQAADYPIAAIRRQITEGIDIMVHLGRTPDGRRLVLEISELAGMEDGEIVLNKLFGYVPNRGLYRTANPLLDKTKLNMKGIKI
jgi:pilus assembly protein CpaF